MSGLKNVFLAGIEMIECERCKSSSPVIPRMYYLHREIAVCLIRKVNPLRGDEVRYIRKWLGFSMKKAASVLGIEEADFHDVENTDGWLLGDSAEKMLKALCLIYLSNTDGKKPIIGDIWQFLTEPGQRTKSSSWLLDYREKRGWAAFTSNRR
jgi:hypothetical protein